MFRRCAIFILVVLPLLALDAIGEAWPQFRGPNGLGLSENSTLPTEWSADKNIRWKIRIPGAAWSSPIVWGDKIFVTTAITENQPKPNAEGNRRRRREAPEGENREGRPEGADSRPQEPTERPREGGERRGGFGRRAPDPPTDVYRWEVHCLNKETGETIWSEQVAEHAPTIPTHRTNTYASETPVTDGERIYAYFGMTGLFCLSVDGKLLWKKEIGSFPMTFGWGTGSSPVLVGDLLVLQCDNDEKSFLVAFDKATGDEKWRVERDEKSTWSTPFLWKNKGRTELVTGGSKAVRSYKPESGELLWELTGISGRSASTPVGDDEMLYLGTGGGMGVGPLIAVKAGATGSIAFADARTSEGLVAWVAPRGGPPMASPLLYQGLLYILEQRGGILTCYDAKTGEVVYKERVPGATGFTSSPWAAGDRIYCTDGEGTTTVLAAGKEFKVLSQNALGEMCWSSPAIAGGAIFLRTLDHLYRIEAKSDV